MRAFIAAHIVGSALRTALLGLLLVAAGFASTARAQEDMVNLRLGRQAVRADVMLHYQSYEEDSLSISQMGIPLRLTAPLSAEWTLSLYAAQMSTTGDGVEDLSGLSDVQLILGYSRRVGMGSVVVSLGANLPSGKKELTRAEFNTVVMLSQRAFDFRVPSLGQGFGLSPSVTWATPVAANMAVGLGASYQVRSGYRPIDTLDDDYTPGNELLFTAGLDTRLDAESSVSVDVTYSMYAADQLGETEVFEAGPKTSVTALYRNVRGFNVLRVEAGYRHRSKSNELQNNVLVTETIQTVPNQAIIRGSYRMRLQPSLDLALLAGGRFFSESKQPKRTMVDVGVEPSFRVSPEAALLARFIYTTGTITGFEGAFGISVGL